MCAKRASDKSPPVNEEGREVIILLKLQDVKAGPYVSWYEMEGRPVVTHAAEPRGRENRNGVPGPSQRKRAASSQ